MTCNKSILDNTAYEYQLINNKLLIDHQLTITERTMQQSLEYFALTRETTKKHGIDKKSGKYKQG